LRYTAFLLILCLFQACVPIQIAPNMDKGKVMDGKKFKQQLPDRQICVFLVILKTQMNLTIISILFFN